MGSSIVTPLRRKKPNSRPSAFSSNLERRLATLGRRVDRAVTEVRQVAAVVTGAGVVLVPRPAKSVLPVKVRAKALEAMPATLARAPETNVLSSSPQTFPTGPTRPSASPSTSRLISSREARAQSREEQKLLGQWLRERQKNPEIAAIPLGATLQKMFVRSENAVPEVHEVQCPMGYYLYRGKKYGTLGRVTKAVAGAKEYPPQRVNGRRPKNGRPRQMCNWSAIRFWGLKRLLQKEPQPVTLRLQ